MLCVTVLIVGAVYLYKHQQRLGPTSSIELKDDSLAVATAAAKNGDAAAAARVSRHFLVKKQYRLAYTWMLRAKQLGDPEAESDLNEMRKFLPPNAITESEFDDSGKAKGN